MYSNDIEHKQAVEMMANSLKGLEKLKSLSIDLSDDLIEDGTAEAVLAFLKERVQ